MPSLVPEKSNRTDTRQGNAGALRPKCDANGLSSQTRDRNGNSPICKSDEGGQKWTAVLDLKYAYDAIRRDQLFERGAKVLPHHITAIIPHTLQTLTVTTVEDDTRNEAKIDRRVTQGGPASPTHFNIFIDTLAKALEKHLWNPNSGLPAHLYADDVIIHVKSMLDLQRALIIYERWALKFGMRWALSKGKSEVLLPSELSLQ